MARYRAEQQAKPFRRRRKPPPAGIECCVLRPPPKDILPMALKPGLEAKRMGLLHEMVPQVATIAVLVNPNFPASGMQLRDVQEAAASLGVQLIIARANVESDFDAAFSTFVQQRAGALLVCASPFFNGRRQQLVVLAARHSMPAMYEWREFVEAGGLMSYGTRLSDSYRQAGV